MSEVAPPVTPVASPAPAGAKPVASAKPPAPAPVNGAKPPPDAQKTYKVDGEEYTEGQLQALLRRGKEGAGLMSAAAKKMAEAEARSADADRREAVWKSGDRNAIFKELEKMGHNPYEMSRAKILEAMEDEKLTPEQKELRDTKAKLTAKEKAEEDAKAKQQEEADAAEVQTLTDQYASTFVNALTAKGIPLTHARALLPNYAQIVHAYDKAGKQPDLETVAEYLAEADTRAFERNLGGLEVDEILKRLGPEKEKALINRAVARYKEQKAGKVGVALPGASPKAATTTGSLPTWVKDLPAAERRAYFEGGESHPDVKAWLARRPGR